MFLPPNTSQLTFVFLSLDGDPTKRNLNQRGRWRWTPREGTKGKLEAPSSEGGKANPGG